MLSYGPALASGTHLRISTAAAALASASAAVTLLCTSSGPARRAGRWLLVLALSSAAALAFVPAGNEVNVFTGLPEDRVARIRATVVRDERTAGGMGEVFVCELHSVESAEGDRAGAEGGAGWAAVAR